MAVLFVLFNVGDLVERAVSAVVTRSWSVWALGTFCLARMGPVVACFFVNTAEVPENDAWSDRAVFALVLT